MVTDILAAEWRHWLSAQFVERVAVLPMTSEECERVLVWQALVEFAEGEARAGHRGIARSMSAADQFEHDEMMRRMHIATKRLPSDVGTRVAVAMVRGLRREIVSGRIDGVTAASAFNANLKAGAFHLIDVNQLARPA